MKVKIGNYRKGSNPKTPRIEKVDIEKWDTYSADHTLSLIIHPLLVKFRDNVLAQGIVPSEFLPTRDVSDLTEEEAAELHARLHVEGSEKWVGILDKMIWSFYQIKTNYYGEKSFFKEVEGNPEDPDYNKFDIDKDGLNDYYEKIDEGAQLFGRYYRSLWW